MTVFEPATLITDGLLAFIGFALAAKMRRGGELMNPAGLMNERIRFISSRGVMLTSLSIWKRRASRLALCELTSRRLKQSLNLPGIDVPERV